MRGAPQVGFSAIIRKISSPTSVDSFFLPTCFVAFEIKLQYSRKPARCQRTTQGLTSTRDCSQAPQKRRAEYPEDFVNCSHPGSGMLALQDDQLLPENEIFQQQASMRLQAAGEQAKP